MKQFLLLQNGAGFKCALLTALILFISTTYSFAKNVEGNVVKVTGDQGHWALTVNGQEFYIKGVGVGHALSDDKKTDFLKLAKNMGANAVRTWGISQATKDYLDQAKSYGLLVDVGFWLNPVHPDGTCSYATDHSYRDKVRQEVLTYIKKYRNHPAVLAWNIGNETIYWTQDEKERIAFVQFLEKLIKEVHRIDPNHPVIYTSAYLTDFDYIAQYVPSLDILGINVYGAVRQTHAQILSQQKIPIIFTEFGPPGPWALAKDVNDRPLELNDQEKADFYSWETAAIFEKKGYNLGGFAFFLGETTQVSLTWWNLNFGDTRKLSFLKIKDLYTATSSKASYPFLKSMSLSKENNIHPGEDVEVALDASGGARGISYAYIASTEFDSSLVENPNQRISLTFDIHDNKAILTAPITPGIYRIYGIISDEQGNYTSTISRTIHVVK
ncbi:MAG: beta-galactosidase [Candidatus Omnitrophica bacterium]|nr:beta-galactosidase [Candidatus Omnitrophota bacterium]